MLSHSRGGVRWLRRSPDSTSPAGMFPPGPAYSNVPPFPHCPHHATSRARLSAARTSASGAGGVERGGSDVVILGAAEVSEVRVEPAIRW